MCDKPECDESVSYVDWMSAVLALRDARLREAESFLRFRVRKDSTDGQAARMAYVDTEGTVDVTLARVDYLRAQMGGR